MDLSRYHGCFLRSVSTSLEANGDARVLISLAEGPDTVVVLELLRVVRLSMDDGFGDWAGFVDDIKVSELPCRGPWPREARHLLHHHNNESAMLWVRLIGPTEIEILARELVVHPRMSGLVPLPELRHQPIE